MAYDEIFTMLALGVEMDSATWKELASTVERSDARLDAVACIGALIALDASETSFATQVDAAIGAGVTTDDIVAALLAVAPVVGTARLVAVAPKVARALDIDVDALLEESSAPRITE